MEVRRHFHLPLRPDVVLVLDNTALVAICESADMDIHDGCFVRKGDARNPVLHALVMGSKLEVRPDDSRGNDVFVSAADTDP